MHAASQQSVPKAQSVPASAQPGAHAPPVQMPLQQSGPWRQAAPTVAHAQRFAELHRRLQQFELVVQAAPTPSQLPPEVLPPDPLPDEPPPEPLAPDPPLEPAVVPEPPEAPAVPEPEPEPKPRRPVLPAEAADPEAPPPVPPPDVVDTGWPEQVHTANAAMNASPTPSLEDARPTMLPPVLRCNIRLSPIGRSPGKRSSSGAANEPQAGLTSGLVFRRLALLAPALAPPRRAPGVYTERSPNPGRILVGGRRR